MDINHLEPVSLKAHSLCCRRKLFCRKGNWPVTVAIANISLRYMAANGHAARPAVDRGCYTHLKQLCAGTPLEETEHRQWPF